MFMKNVWTLCKKHVFFAERRCDLRLFPTVSPWTPLDLQKTALRGNAYFKKNAGWTSFGLIMFPTVSDCFRPFHFFWTINWTTSIYGRLIQCKPVQTMTLKFFGATLVRVHCTKYCILTLISNNPQKSQNPRSSWNLIQHIYIYILYIYIYIYIPFNLQMILP